MKDSLLKKILGHPDEDEIISKLALGVDPSEVHKWLDEKYRPSGQTSFVVSFGILTKFKNDYLDMYQHIRNDMRIIKGNPQQEIELSIKKNPKYKERIKDLVNNEINLKQTVANLVVAIESRVELLFDRMQENNDANGYNSKEERVFIELARVLGEILEKYHKFVEVPNESMVINNNVTFQIMDQQVSVFHDVIKEVLQSMDIESSLKFMDLFNEKMTKLRPPVDEKFQSVESRAVDAKLLTENMSKKLSEIK